MPPGLRVCFSCGVMVGITSTASTAPGAATRCAASLSSSNGLPQNAPMCAASGACAPVSRTRPRVRDGTRLGRDPKGNPNYRVYRHSCGHSQRVARVNMSWGQVQCAGCGGLGTPGFLHLPAPDRDAEDGASCSEAWVQPHPGQALSPSAGPAALGAGRAGPGATHWALAMRPAPRNPQRMRPCGGTIRTPSSRLRSMQAF